VEPDAFDQAAEGLDEKPAAWPPTEVPEQEFGTRMLSNPKIVEALMSFGAEPAWSDNGNDPDVE
jgi:hypothetical protein